MPGSTAPMTEAMYYVLLALLQSNHGYQLMTVVEQVSHNRVKMGPGTLYGLLSKMQKDKFIIMLSDDGRRKTYSITNKGMAALEAEYERIKAMAEDGKIIRGVQIDV
ncbi:MAG TPA: PadR family transcriptional regulator [Mobilitalea sp.]|nr:PadR family transcriptional regulator [Mobilitalea sp.]